MINEGLDYKRHYDVFNATEIAKLEDESRAVLNRVYDMKKSCRHPEQHLQWLSQGRVTLFYCGTCGESFTYDAPGGSISDLLDAVRAKRVAK